MLINICKRISFVAIRSMNELADDIKSQNVGERNEITCFYYY